MIGVAEYDKNTNDFPIVMKLETGQADDYFVGFNRATGPNWQNKQADDQVTIYQVKEGDGMSYSHSTLKANLGAGGSLKINNWRRTGRALTIQVNEINLGVTPGFADIAVTFEGDGTTPDTPNPTPSPTAVRTRGIFEFLLIDISTWY